MTYTPIIPIGGYAGWAFLKRTMAQQTNAFNAQASIKRDEAYFREKIGSITSAEQLVNDPRLLRVALGAFGLEADIGNKFFIRKVLEDGTLKAGALANKLANKQYQKLSTTFGFGDFNTPRTKLSDFADKILGSYKTQQFFVAVGTQNEDMRLALNIEQELPVLAKTEASTLSKWFTVMGNPPLRKVFERAFGLPVSFGAIDIDKQAETLQNRSKAMFGTDDLSQFSDGDKVDKLVRQFLVRSELAASSASLSSGQVALALLQSNVSRFRLN
ncbi:DUF1217 domain-containing protein [Pseudotabrizicola sp. 4114]|uniref:DUF1217 domain-containing protein n=1 Tax=Pseudotabrizicola sp. 4114 TaxID=2817731 RepID=UPI0028577047|nr:hypothetical protein [Pseudorhodobacter sp. 4114]